MHTTPSGPPLGLAPRALLFDLDGTILDTRHWHMLAWRELVRRHDFPERYYHQAEHGFGQTNWAIFDTWFGGRRDKQHDYAALADEKEALFREFMHGHAVARPGFFELLAAVKRRNWRVGLSTSAPHENALFMLREIGALELFDGLIWGGDHLSSKPHPDAFILAAAKIGARPSHCVGIEDSTHGFWAIRRAGMPIVAIAETPAKFTQCRMWTPHVMQDFKPLLRMVRDWY